MAVGPGAQIEVHLHRHELVLLLFWHGALLTPVLPRSVTTTQAHRPRTHTTLIINAQSSNDAEARAARWPRTHSAFTMRVKSKYPMKAVTTVVRGHAPLDALMRSYNTFSTCAKQDQSGFTVGHKRLIAHTRTELI